MLSAVAAQDLGVVRRQTPVDLFPPSGLNIHYGSPVITPANTVLVPVKGKGRVRFSVRGLPEPPPASASWRQPPL